MKSLHYESGGADMNANIETFEKNEPNEDQSICSPINRTFLNSFITNTRMEDQALLTRDVGMAKRFLTLISECDEPLFAFQIFSDKKDVAIPPQIFCGPFEDHEATLIRHNQTGAGVFVTINQTDGNGRKTENITGISTLS